jgi:dihydrofolate reductase
MNAILSLTVDDGVGYRGKLLHRIPEDMRRFKIKTTIGDCNVVIMGRKTYDSIGRALPGRCNIVVSRRKLVLDDAVVVNTVREAISYTKYSDNVYVIGGSKIMNMFSDYIRNMYITRIYTCNEVCDTYYSIPETFHRVSAGDVHTTRRGVSYVYEKWVQIKYRHILDYTS